MEAPELEPPCLRARTRVLGQKTLGMGSARDTMAAHERATVEEGGERNAARPTLRRTSVWDPWAEGEAESSVHSEDVPERTVMQRGKSRRGPRPRPPLRASLLLPHTPVAEEEVDTKDEMSYLAAMAPSWPPVGCQLPRRNTALTGPRNTPAAAAHTWAQEEGQHKENVTQPASEGVRVVAHGRDGEERGGWKTQTLPH